MRINDLLSEQERLDEKPMGFLKKMGNKVAASFGSQKAAGRLEAGEEANWLKNQYMKYLGATGSKPEPENVLAFLKKNGYPTGAAAQAMGQKTGAEKAGQVVGKGAAAVGKGLAKAGKAVGGALKGVAQTAAAGAKAGAAATQQPAQGPQATPPQAQQQPAAQKPAAQPTATKAAPAAPATAPKQAPTPAPSAAQPTTAKVAPSKGAVKIAGKPRIKPKTKPAMQVASTQYDGAEVIMEKLSGGQLDAVFKAAVQDAVRRDAGGLATDQSGQGPAGGAAPGGAAGFAAGVKSGVASANDKNADGKDDTTGEPVAEPASEKPSNATAAQGDGTAPVEIPKNIQRQLGMLSPEQRKELAGML